MTGPGTLAQPPSLLSWAILCSLLVHAVMLFGWQTKQPEIVFSSQPLSVRVVAGKKRSPSPDRAALGAVETEPSTAQAASQTPAVAQRIPTLKKPHTPSAARTETKPAVTAAQTPQSVPQSPPVHAVSDPQASSEDSETENRSSVNISLLAHLREALSRHFTYPPLARRRGWEGEVVLEFVLRPNGRIDAIEVTKSSGFGLLDRSARNALAKVGRLPVTGLHLVSARTLELPVQYQLNDN